MTLQINPVFTGNTAGDGTGDQLRVAFSKINLNFANIAGGQLDAGNVVYTAANSANWTYTVSTVSEALDQLAARLKAGGL
jgi:hypothetical protein